MCGICGVLTWQRGGVDPSDIVRMRDTMVHRGPDADGLYVSPDHTVGLGFRRLAIIDLSPAGNQPMTNEDGSVWIVFNGEIYNHRHLRHQLEAKGHLYRSHSDTETLLHLYEERGLDFVHGLEGMFAIGLWDSKRRRLVLIRDRLGVKPLYYAELNGQVLFASEIKALLAHPAVHADLDETALYHYLTFATTPAPMTLFKGIQKLEPGTLVTWEDGHKTCTQYWEPIVPHDLSASDETLARDRIRELLSESVEKRMMSDVPFGVFLSGGVDSSTNVALMSRYSDQPVRTFTVAFKRNEAYNELEYARQIAREFKTDHHEIHIDQDDLMDYLPKLIFHQDEPIADPVCVPLYYVSKLARDNDTIVVQVGEGSDELFCGYRHYMAVLELYNKAWRYVAATPRLFRRIGYAVGSAGLQMMGRGKFNDFFRRAAEGEELFWGGANAFFELEKRALLSPEFRQRHSGLTSWDVVRGLYQRLDSVKQADYLERMIYLELKLRLAELLLMRVDKITMSTSVEARVPFLDHKLVEFAMSVPTSLKTKGGTSKYILKKAVEGIIPHNIIYRRKQGFGVPINEWFWEAFGDFAEERMLGTRLHERGIFNVEFIRERLAAQRSGKGNYSFQLWNLFNLALWYDYWIGGRGDRAAS